MELLPYQHTEQYQDDGITYELLTYVFGYIPSVGKTISLHRIAEDLDEAPDTILRVLDELREDKFIGFTHNENTVTITYKDEIFLQQYSVYQAAKR